MRWLLLGVLAATGAALFLLPHHAKTETNRLRTLAAIFLDIFDSREERWWASLEKITIRLAGAVATLGVFYPLAVAAVMPRVPAEWRVPVLITAGLAGLLIAGLTAFFIFLSNVTFAFGGSSGAAPATPVAILAPLFIAACGLWFVVAAFSPAALRGSRLAG